jgi:membrane protein required for colicin V production
MSMVFTGVDVGVAVLVLISAVLATARGFTREILSLATWAGSAAIAAYMYFYHNDIASKYIDNPLIATGVTIVGTFLVALIVLHLLTMWIGDMVVDSRVGPLDRTLGFVFGAARGFLICVIGWVMLSWLLQGKNPAWAETARTRPALESTGESLRNSIVAVFPDADKLIDSFRNRGPVPGEPAEPAEPDPQRPGQPAPPQPPRRS